MHPCRALLSSKTFSLQLQLLILKLQLYSSYCGCYEWFQQSNSSVQRCVATTSSYIATQNFKAKVVVSCTICHIHLWTYQIIQHILIATQYITSWRVGWLGAYTASDKCPTPEKAPDKQDQILCVHIRRIFSSQTLLFIYTCSMW